ncbi:MAG: hypothetical protein HKP48_07695 [Winogradskyella sp.]|uniref:hypothetical protein n=1 Tax=Winogradskyella sp. TaxID=1883156 RepID=UPI0017A9B2BC|nr:hypothetical protein [Winogradskyella sp.]MBT8244747.1 hypothetical protein [Winogradskyella sp.]NNK23165.1 hypothetical protein [Winogradskyella sp.]
MVDSYQNQNKRVLLVGNGVNLIDSSQSFSWEALLQELKNTYGINVDLDNVFKPFPLAFDEMIHQKPSSNDFHDKLKTIKQKISHSIQKQIEGKRGFNQYHEKIMSLPYNDILTTNYDYSLQKSLTPEFLNLKEKFAINKQERKFNLKRGYSVSDKNIWHIHG